MVVDKIIIHSLGGDINHPPTQTFTPEEFITKLNDGSFEKIFNKEKEKYRDEEENYNSSWNAKVDRLYLIGRDKCTRCPLWANLQRKEGKT